MQQLEPGQPAGTAQPSQKMQTPGIAPMTPPSQTFGAAGRPQAMQPPSRFTPNQPTPTPLGTTPQLTPASQPSVTPLGYGTQSTIQPGQDLRGSTITPGAESNRLDLAKQYLDTYSQSQLPQFQSQLRSAIQSRAALGGLGSGMLNTDVGNLDLAAQRDYNTHAQNFLTDALGSQISDNANYRNELRGERGYENGLEAQAYDRSRQGLYDQDYLTNSAFGRAAQQAQFGYGGNPSSAQAAAGDYYGQQASNASNALGGLIQNSQLLQALGIGGQSSSGLTPEQEATLSQPAILGAIGGR